MVGQDIISAADRARQKLLNAEQAQRKTKGGNDLLFYFLLELRDMYNQKQENQGRHMGFNLGKAAMQIQNEPEAITTVDQLKSVKFVGPVIITFVRKALWEQQSQPQDDEKALDESIEEGFSQPLQPLNPAGGSKRKRAASSQAVARSNGSGSKQAEYVPQHGSANYAFLVVMYQQLMVKRQAEFGKEELMELAEKSGLATKSIYGDSIRNNRYDGWSCIRGMLQREPPLIHIWSCPLKCQLTDAGVELGGKLYQVACQQGHVPPIATNEIEIDNVTYPSSNAHSQKQIKEAGKRKPKQKNNEDSLEQSNKQHSQQQFSQQQCIENMYTSEFQAMEQMSSDVAIPDQEPWKMPSLSGKAVVRLPPPSQNSSLQDSYDIILLVDQREQFSQGGRSKSRSESLEAHMQRLFVQGITAEVRTLPVGDALWIARNKYTREEYVLDFIVERKGVEDLYSSIKDRRYETQKYSLKRCGLPYCFYLVEGDIDLVDGNQAIKTAAVSTEVLDGFTVLRSGNIAGTFKMYCRLTAAITHLYMSASPSETLSNGNLLSFQEFSTNVSGNKKTTITETWGLMLTAVPGMGKHAAFAIMDIYPTPLKFYQAFGELQCEDEVIKRIGSLKAGQKAIGENVARCLYDALLT